MKTRTAVTSSNIEAVSHDPATNTLEIEFKNGSRYRYSDVPAHVADALIKSPSIGSHLAQHIRGKYAHEKV